MSKIIFYGAGENARKNLLRWYENGLKPVCFVDADMGKQYTIFDTPHSVGKVEVLPLLEAIGKYPDYILYLTQQKEMLANVTQYLLSLGITAERIRYCDGFNSPQFCRFLDYNAILIETDSKGKTVFTSCCANGWRKIIFCSSGNFEYDYKRLCNYNEKLKQMLKDGYHTICNDCSWLSYKCEQDSKTLFVIASGIKYGDSCNFSCSYCIYPQIRHGQHEASVEYDDKRYDIIEILRYIENNYKSEEVEINFAAGEISIQNESRDEILKIWNRNKWHGQIATNASVFLPGIASLSEQKLVAVVTALDCGTPETFKKIKGVNIFDKVVSNLEKYAATGGVLSVKYIVLKGINDNEYEIDMFFNVMAKISKNNSNVLVCLSRDFLENYFELTENEIKAFKYLIEKTKQIGLNYIFTKESFSQRDIDAITNP